LLHILLLTFSLHCHSQNFELQLTGRSLTENKVIDSLNYISQHKNLKSLRTEIETTSQKLSKLGYIENKVTERLQGNDSTFIARFHLGTRIKFIHIYLGANKTVANLLSPHTIQDSIFLQYTEVETFLKQNTSALERIGYSLAKLQLTNIKKKRNTLFTELQFESEDQRQLNAIIIKHKNNQQKNNFPKGHLTQIRRKYKNKIFNQDIVSKIHNEFERFDFVNQIKYPEILFTKDSTKVYVYLEKRKSNTFDGFIGFNNNDNKKITFNGYLNVTLENTLQVGEQFSLYWKTDGNKQRTFKASLELPYLFKSPIGVKGELTIFKQDSTFQNTKTEIDISYFLNYDTRFYLGYQSTISSDIQNTNDSFISDYKNSYLTSELSYSKSDDHSSLFLNKSKLNIKTGIGKRETNDKNNNTITNPQFYIDLSAMHTFYLNGKNSINIRSQNHYLKSTNYITNELLRFGGINSIRGFTENSLQANFMTTILTEYRYTASPTLYFHTIVDYSRFNDPAKPETIKTTDSLFSVGFGLGLQTKNGLLKLAFANGLNNTDTLTLSNTIIHISYNVKF
jgi:hypothetical protein